MTDPTAVAATAAPEARHDGDVPFHEGELRLQEVFNEQVRAKRISFSVRYGFVDRTRAPALFRSEVRYTCLGVCGVAW